VLEGSVRKAGDRVRITGQLIDTATDANIWADRFDGSLEDVFELQDKVATSVAGVIETCPTNRRGRTLGQLSDDGSESVRRLSARLRDAPSIRPVDPAGSRPPGESYCA